MSEVPLLSVWAWYCCALDTPLMRPRVYSERLRQAKRHTQARLKMRSLVNSLRLMTFPTEAHTPPLSPAGLTHAQRLTWRCACIYFKLTLWVSEVAYSVVGLENLDPKVRVY